MTEDSAGGDNFILSSRYAVTNNSPMSGLSWKSRSFWIGSKAFSLALHWPSLFCPSIPVKYDYKHFTTCVATVALPAYLL